MEQSTFIYGDDCEAVMSVYFLGKTKIELNRIMIRPSSEQVRVGTCPRQEEEKRIIVGSVYQEPIRNDVTFPETDIITG